MPSLLESLTGEMLGGDTIGQLSNAIGADPGTTAKALSGALPMLLGGLAKNSEDSGGAASLASALDRDHDGSVLDNLGGFLSGGAAAAAGSGILRHVLGGKQATAEQTISKTSGLDTGQAANLLAMAAPLIMGFLGRQKKQQGFDAGQLASMLGGARDDMVKKQPDAMSALAGLLDSDGDGSVMDDVASLGSSLLGGFLKGR